MKKIGFSLLASLLLVSGTFAQKSIVVINNSTLDRNAEMVEVKACNKKDCKLNKPFLLKNNDGKEIAYQLIYSDKKEVSGFIFQADVKAKSNATYWIKAGTPSPVTAKTHGRFVPERKDDFAWENDMAAYRMYGPALAKENASNGVDYWAKCTDKLVVDQRYKDDIYNEISYHIDHGKGLDFYKVAHTLGCGGVAPYANDSLWVGNQFDSYQVLVDGPLRTEFTLTYNNFKVGNESYKETITITSDAGSLLNKAVVTYSGKAQKMQLGTGIYLHDGKGRKHETISKEYTDSTKATLLKSWGGIAYAENAVSDAGVPSGTDYVGVVVPTSLIESKKSNEHFLLLSDYVIGSSFTYYFGAGWSKWKYPTDADWFKAVTDFSTKTKSPLKVIMK